MRPFMTQLNSSTLTLKQFAKTIDHSLLKPELTEADVIAGCELAKKYDVASVCVKPCHVRLAARLLKGSDVKVGTVIGFPHGSSTTVIKVAEARQALNDGAVELDMVINIGELRSGHYDYVRNEIKVIVDVAHSANAIVKVIFENAYLSDEQKVVACHLSEEAGADFVKTSTGFAATGATLDDVRLMHNNVGPNVQIKAAHGVRTMEAALQMIDAGVTRIGATATATMLDDFAKLRSQK
jgi:deoxyribose-phosphate aldolase